LSNSPQAPAETRLSISNFSVTAFTSQASERQAMFPAAASLQTGSSAGFSFFVFSLTPET
jgi:hypothetical protein